MFWIRMNEQSGKCLPRLTVKRLRFVYRRKVANDGKLEASLEKDRFPPAHM